MQLFIVWKIFYDSKIYQLLKEGKTEYRFELEFNTDNKQGFIDFIYFDKKKNGWIIIDFKTGKKTEDKIEKYQEQLDFYTKIMTELGYDVVGAELLWI